ncbi:ribosome biogenesis GTP-binding protein YlqF [Enterococcus sp. DIV0609]|uniref:ribosome biogenesis GTPase YlqF n=1 Tax=Enterococcus TaxID=1350 RepID=UPI000450160F|nr:ribosome biogenesis GTPase YlqF [Enterococcus faecalis]EGO9794261.1 ribosome biogenesis GTPase YlqF [Enterococcus faecalis]EIB6816698.1 ribosome biogenesis GTPase YlqF [Enterococcus faecalis]EKA3596721.1 ribosome biogenesis GTPase YlqF [Enterococcus faecalis]ETU57985.1 ribosome biogenesis GTP-binding protein YlqF [Enterococcus faecalis EnGen0424]NSM27249.1 ribosome biogenesis GTPase YlqF [Enterococcus faecalis]
MTIQWFPGHMAKARREVSEKIKYVDIVFELVDARLPLSSRNPMMDQIVQQKPRLVLLNKGDLADNDQNKKWQHYFQKKGYQTLVINAQQNKGINKIVPAAKEALKEKLAREQAKGLKPRAIRAMCIGIPNVGKSTLMNRLVGKKIAQTGNKPGVTKGQQWLRSGSQLELLDTPGILWPKFEDEEIGKKLALTGAIKDQLLHLDDLAIYGLEFFARFYPQRLTERFGLQEEELFLPAPEQLMLISQKRGFRDDYNRASEMIILEIRSGKLGTYTLDRWEELGDE